MDTKFSNHSENIRELLHIPGTCIFRTYTDTPNLMHSLHVYTVAADYIYCITFKKIITVSNLSPVTETKPREFNIFYKYQYIILFWLITRTHTMHISLKMNKENTKHRWTQRLSDRWTDRWTNKVDKSSAQTKLLNNV